MNFFMSIFNSPGHMLLAIVVGDATMAYLLYRFIRWFIRGFAKEQA